LAYWCKTGRHWSPQAESLRGFIATGVVVAAIALLAGATG
jgi:hypothetical protein